ncbi:hypothetical protein V7S43_004629 [Phytophthora oleae]|uniref:Crinkler effector protein N-terminal domain-containing protein n=1 Tax=Phytophthora oleae TaxID=2107226 RepID=A0ABD3FUB1_9STRA
MVAIFCAIPGPGSVFPVNINMNQTVGHLKEKIKEEMPNMIYFDAGLLKLYLARDNGAWLNANDDDFKALERREIPYRVKDLMQEQLVLDAIWQLNDDACFGKNFQPAARDIHVLVKKPEDPKEFLQYKRSGSTVCGILPLQSLQSALQWLFGSNQVPQTKKTD